MKRDLKSMISGLFFVNVRIFAGDMWKTLEKPGK
jgi:hypothetical protein